MLFYSVSSLLKQVSHSAVGELIVAHHAAANHAAIKVVIHLLVNAFANMYTIVHALTQSDVVFKSKFLSAAHSADGFLSTTKYKDADMFLSITV